MKIFFTIAALFIALSTTAQNIQNVVSLINEAQTEPNDSLRGEIANYAANTFESVISAEDDFTATLDDIKPISVLTSSDNRIRIFSWGIQFADGTYTYYGFVQTRSDDGDVVTTRLIDKSDSTPNAAKSSMQPDNWYGAIYYELVPVGGKKSHLYALAGWDGADLFVNRKVLEQVRVKSDGSIYFGGYFTDEHNQNYDRLIFEYTERAVMSLRYDLKLKMFIADHMMIPEQYNGNTKFSGPDGSFDGYKFMKDGTWMYVPDLDIKGARF